MEDTFKNFDFFHTLHWLDLSLVLAIVVVFWALAQLARWALKRWAENVKPSSRLKILRFVPWVKISFGIAALTQIAPILIEPSFQNILALFVSSAVLIAFVFKDYASSVMAGMLVVFEDVYQLGDWVEIDGAYGEVILINPRAVHLLTAEDDEIIIPHTQLWSKKMVNASSGQRSMMCIANFYLQAAHDGMAVLACLKEIGQSSTYRAPDSQVAVVAQETPWGTHYKIKAYVKESREQFTFITDLTLRGKKALQDMKVDFAQVAPAMTWAKS